MDLEIGSNLYQNTDGTVEVEGLPQITLTQKRPGGPLLVSLVLYDATGRVLAKVVDSTIAFNERRAFELNKTDKGLVISETESGKVVLKVELRADSRAVISHAEFLSVRGHLLEVTPTEWKIEKRRMSGQTTDAKGLGVALG
jgi:hypothetical protein